MAKKVRYNGGTMSYKGCSDSKVLEIGKVYEVVYSRDLGFQTNYTLKGVIGEFNSVWFDEVTSEEKVYMAVSHDIPKIGENYFCLRTDFIDNQFVITKCTTSKVKHIENMGNGIYKVITNNSTYIVKVN